jgi:CarD family transcriptional regulator
MFSLDEKVVYPGHGVAKINRIVEKIVQGRSEKFFELVFINKDMTILVPMSNITSTGIRKLSSTQNVDSIFALLAEPARVYHDPTIINWNKRNKEYQCRLRTGDLREIGKIYRDLTLISKHKELLLVEEISIVKSLAEEQTTKELRSVFLQKIMASTQNIA